MTSFAIAAQVTIQNYAWILLFGVALLTSLAGVFLIAGDAHKEFENDTGVSWDELSDQFPTVATQFLIARQGGVVGTFAVALFALAVTYFAFRTGQRWSWFAMWILPLNAIPGIISLYRTENQKTVAYFGAVIVAIAVAGLLLSIPVFF